MNVYRKFNTLLLFKVYYQNNKYTNKIQLKIHYRKQPLPTLHQDDMDEPQLTKVSSNTLTPVQTKILSKKQNSGMYSQRLIWLL